MNKVLGYLSICVFLLSCGSQPENVNKQVQKYEISKGGEVLLSAYNKIATKTSCNDSNHSKKYLDVTTMPVSCYFRGSSSFLVGKNPDAPISTGTQFENHDSAFSVQWQFSRKGWDSWGDCKPDSIYFPINDTSKNNSIVIWLVEMNDFQYFIKNSKDTVLPKRGVGLLNEGLKPILAKNILSVSDWTVEDPINGFCAKTYPSDYANLYCSAGVTVKVRIIENNKSVTKQCYLLVNNDERSMRWKDSVIQKGSY